MSNNSVNDSDHALVQRRLVRDLKVLVIVQVVALFVVGLGLYLFGNDVVPNTPAWDGIHTLCGVLALAGMIVFVVAAFWGLCKFARLLYITRWLAKRAKNGTMQT